jgi:polysaccharide biosynthesis transport protein
MSDWLEDDGRGETAPRDVVAAVRRDLPVVLLVTSLVAITSVLVSLALPDRYSASASVVLDASQALGAGQDVNMATEKQVASSVAVAERVIRQLTVRETPQQVLSGLSLSVPVDTDVLVFAYTAGDPRVAQRLAQAFADAYLEYHREELGQAIAAVTSAIDDRIETLRRELTTATERAAGQSDAAKRAALHVAVTSLLAQIGVQEQRAASATDGLSVTGRVLAAASKPVGPSQPRLPVNVLIGVVLGLLLGVCVAAARASLGRRIGSERDVTQATGSSVIAVIPRTRRFPRDSSAVLAAPATAHGAAYRRLAATLVAGFAPSLGPGDRFGRGGFSIAVVGLDERTDTTLVVANLGSVIARSGRGVVIVSASAGSTGLASIFGTPDAPGLRDVLARDVVLSRALHRSRVRSLEVMPGGSIHRDLAMLDTTGARGLVHDLTRVFDVALLDVPAGAVTDSSAVIRACDAVVVVVSLRTTPFEAAERVRRELSTLGSRTLGTVVFERRPPRRRHSVPPDVPAAAEGWGDDVAVAGPAFPEPSQVRSP